MSGQWVRSIGETAAERMTELSARLEEAWSRFRESRLYVQVVLSLALVGVTGATSLWPVGSLGRLRAALAWTATHDYDFAGDVSKANAWARVRGGWGPAVAGVWKTGTGKVQGWIAKTRPAGLAPAAPEEQSSLLVATGWRVPVSGGAVLYGYGWLPNAVSDKLHEGIDFLAPVAAPVVAVSDGTVTRVASDPGLGAFVEVVHGTLVARYAQVTAIRVQVGDHVQKGQELAVVGNPAGAEKSMEPHLHFELRLSASQPPIDPASYLGLGGNKL
jgi:murein DD-endopeptidase MepM/ murein hydrolase activator NlpD